MSKKIISHEKEMSHSEAMLGKKKKRVREKYSMCEKL